MAPWLVMRVPSFVPAGLAACTLLMLSACAHAVIVAPPGPPTPPRVDAEEAGSASWYGFPYHGRQTASGEVYDMHELTAAHRTLPLGTRLMVTNIANGQAVEVRVNDRGPFVGDRILDLSYGAAQVVGAVGPGVIRVRLRVIALQGEPRGPPTASSGAGFSVQVGAFTDRARAETLRGAVERDGSEAVVFDAWPSSAPMGLREALRNRQIADEFSPGARHRRGPIVAETLGLRSGVRPRAPPQKCVALAVVDIDRRDVADPLVGAGVGGASGDVRHRRPQRRQVAAAERDDGHGHDAASAGAGAERAGRVGPRICGRPGVGVGGSLVPGTQQEEILPSISPSQFMLAVAR